MYLLMILENDASTLVFFDETKGSVVKDLNQIMNTTYSPFAQDSTSFVIMSNKANPSSIMNYHLHQFSWNNGHAFAENTVANMLYFSSLSRNEETEPEVLKVDKIRGPVFISKECSGKFLDMTTEDACWIFDRMAQITQKKSKGRCVIL